MSTYVDHYDDHHQRATATVVEETRAARVTYTGDDGKQFKVMVRQKPNAIGFRARLPGDRVRK